MSDRKKVPAPAATTAKQPPKPAKQAKPPVPAAPSKEPARGDDFSQTPVTGVHNVAAPATGTMPLTKSPRRTLTGGMNTKLFPPVVPEPDIDPNTITLPPSFYNAIPQGHLKIDWTSLRMPFATRAIPLSTEDLDQLEANWRATYGWVIDLGFPPDLALKAANLGTPMAYDYALQRDFPDFQTRFTRDFEKLLPPGQSLPTAYMVPVLSAVEVVSEKLFHKKVNVTSF